MRIRRAGIAVAVALMLVTVTRSEDPKSTQKKTGDTKSAVGKSASKLSAGAPAEEFVTKAMQEWFGSGGTPPLPSHPEPPKQPAAPAATGAVIKDWDRLFEVTLPANFPLPTRAHRVLEDGVTQYYSYTSEYSGDACVVASA